MLFSRVAGAYVGAVVPICSCLLPPMASLPGPALDKDPISLQDLWQISLKPRAPGLRGTLNLALSETNRMWTAWADIPGRCQGVVGLYGEHVGTLNLCSTGERAGQRQSLL